MQRWLIMGLLLLAAVCFSCSKKSGGNGGDGDGGDDTNPPGPDITVGESIKIDGYDDVKKYNVAIAAISLAVDPLGRWAVAYYKQSDQAQGPCTNPITGGGSTQISLTSIYYATFGDTGDNLLKQEVTSDDANKLKATFLPGISLVFNQANVPLIAYLGGTEPSQCCGGGDLMQAYRDGNWSIRNISNVSNNPNNFQDSADAPAGTDPNHSNADDPGYNNCPLGQNLCDTGDTVGLYPSQAVAPTSGTVGIVYKDMHLCYAITDVDDADVNIASMVDTNSPPSHEWIDLGRGGGYYSKLVYDNNDVPAVAFYNGKWGGGMINFSRKETDHWPWNYCEHDTDCSNGQICAFTRCATVVEKDIPGLPEGSLSLVIDNTGRYLLAYFNSHTKHLVFAHSEDGKTWSSGEIDTDGSTGKFPSVLVDPTTGNPMIVYYRCGETGDGLSCNDDRDGLRLAVFVGTYPGDLTTKSKWKKYREEKFPFSAGFEGRFASAAIQSDGTIGVAYLYVDQTQRVLVFRTIKFP
jgi:hypothetical protein